MCRVVSMCVGLVVCGSEESVGWGCVGGEEGTRGTGDRVTSYQRTARLLACTDRCGPTLPSEMS